MSKPRVQVRTRVNFRKWHDESHVFAVLLDVHPREEGCVRFFDSRGFWDDKPESIILAGSSIVGPEIYKDCARQMVEMGYVFTVKRAI